LAGTGGGFRTLTATLDNSGLLDFLCNANVTASGGVDQRGTLSLATGRTLAITGALRLPSGSTTSIASGATMTVSAGCTSTGGTITGAGSYPACP
jgi:hypothetical protein